PSVDAVGLVVDRPEKVRSLPQVGESEFIEELLAAHPSGSLFPDFRIVVLSVGDRVIEDRGIRRQARDRQFVDISFQAPAREQRASDVVEPNAWPASCSSFVPFMVFTASSLVR